MTSGIIGLGNMGGRLGRRIRDAGLPDQISNRVVDAIGDIAGGVRVQQEARASS
jgi:3-hydroxyisobutyrate dehydrogenase-like beta-hydroxyacid dehydrogenase